MTDKKEREILYIGLKMVNGSKEELISRIEDFLEVNKDARVYCDHVTLEFKPAEDSEILKWVKENEGRTIKVLAEKYGIDINECGEVCAFGILFDEDVPCRNEIPHVTLTCTGNRKPVESNNIKEKEWKEIIPFELDTEVCIWYK